MAEAEWDIPPNSKNVEFLSWLVQISSNPQEIIFDGFMGTGSTALAAVLTGREYLGAEINREYYEISQRRIEEVKLLEREGN